MHEDVKTFYLIIDFHRIYLPKIREDGRRINDKGLVKTRRVIVSYELQSNKQHVHEC